MNHYTKKSQNITTTICILALFLSTATTSLASDWFFDKDSIGGTCSNTGPGTITQPFCSIFGMLWDKSWNGAQAGDNIYIRQGTYGGRLFWIKEGVLNNGTPSNPIIIRPYPNETVIFDGATGAQADMLINFSGTTNYVHDLKFIGPFEARNYTKILDGDGIADTAKFRTNLVFEGWTIHNGSAGFIFRYVNGVTVKNSAFYELKGKPSGIDDNVMAVSVRGGIGHISDNITIDNCVAYDINDGKGNDNGDADGFHTDLYVNHFTIKNSSAYRCSEDGIDTKARIVLMENVEAYDNGATGIKMWGGNIGVPSTYTMRNALTYGNSETGVKCTGWGDATNNQVTAIVDHLTSWGNGEDGFKLSVATDTSAGCNVTLRNSIIGETRDRAVTVYVPRAGYETTMNLQYTNLYHSGTHNTITIMGCDTLSSKYTSNQYLAGGYNTDLSSSYSCGGVYGVVIGTSNNPFISNPLLTDPQYKFKWASIATTSIISNSLILVTESSYPWPSPVVGEYIEIDDDGVKRRITSVGDAANRTIGFTPSVSSTVCGRATDCRGSRVVGWGSDNTTHTNNMTLTDSSPAIDAGVRISGVHCAQNDEEGGSALGNCIHWSGISPDLGFYEFGLNKFSTLSAPQINKITPH